jgi:hypothetical protein
MPSSPADTFSLIMTLTNKLANELPRNSQIAELRFLVSEYGKQQPKPPRKRKRDWAGQKRRQRARRRQLAITPEPPVG